MVRGKIFGESIPEEKKIVTAEEVTKQEQD